MRCTLVNLLLLAACGFGQGLDGTWLGTLGGESSLRLLFHVQGNTGAVLSVDRGTTNSIDSVAVSGSRVRIEVRRIRGTYEGVLTQDGKEIHGFWIQPGRRMPLNLARIEKGSVSADLGVAVDVFVPAPPTAVRADGKSRLAYEVHVTNWSHEDMTLLRLEVLVGDETAVIEGDALKRLTLGGRVNLPPEVRTAILVFLTGDAFPSFLRHRLTVRQASRKEPMTVECGRIPVHKDVVRISAPVRGSGWWVGAGPDSSLHHRSALLALDGRLTVAQRFAFDFSRRRSETEEIPIREPMDNRSHPTYGLEALAVGDGRIVSVKDGLPDNVPYDIAPAVPISRETILGNHVVLDLGQGRYAVYAHLQPHLRVRPGEKVLRGQVLGLIGDSGHCDAPHLHFHLTDGKDPLASEGIPFVFDSFSRNGILHHDEMPLADWVIDFVPESHAASH